MRWTGFPNIFNMETPYLDTDIVHVGFDKKAAELQSYKSAA